MGLAEQVTSKLFLDDGVYSLWARDVPSPVSQGKLPGSNLYGTHPFYMARATDDTWFGVYTNLAAAQDWFIKNNAQDGKVDVKTYATGGLGDIYFLFGSNPGEVAQMYQSAIAGEPVLVPQWALGWNHCRYGYQNSTQVAEAVAGYYENAIPLDTQWVDIDYMKNYENFVVDDQRFGGLRAIVDQLHEDN